MKKSYFFRFPLILLLTVVFQLHSSAFNVNETETDSINIALIATPSTSFVSGWESLAAVNDGATPSNSNDKSSTAYGNWDTPDSYQWVQYDWDKEYIATSVEIYWFDDNGGVLTPNEAYIETYDQESSEWVKVVDVPCVKDQFNAASLGEITTSKLRVTMRNYNQSTGILEFRVWGRSLSGSTDIEAPTAPGTPEILGISETSVSISWEESTDDDKVATYYVLLNDSIYKEAPYHMATLKGMERNTVFMLAVQAVDAAGNLSRPSEGIWVFFGDDEQAAEPFTWPEYSPTLDYNFRDEYPTLAMPTKDLDDCPSVVGTQSSGWWTFKWGPNKRSEITEAAITPMLERLNKDFAYFRDTMGWPPDKRAKEGYRSAVYLYGSGLCTDAADTTALGGWMGAISYQNESWPMILASYYPIYSFDPSCPYGDREAQMGAMVHEGIHAVLADMPGAKQAAWFQEGGNTWLQQEMEATKSQDYSEMGFLNAAAYIAPFMPIECYTGWLQDGSFGGPSAEGVNMFDGSQQICTWRRLLGGNQYGNTFPTFLGQVLGKGSVPWIWQNCPERVLEGMGDGLGDMQIRRLIMEYRAKQALVDMGEWTGAIKKLLNANMGGSIGAEWQPSWIQCTPWKATPYVKTWMRDTENKILTPEPRTTPGWSGANQIPLLVSGTQVEVNFMPLGSNMTCQLVYRATDGTPVYSKPVSSGSCKLKLDKVPANGVVIAVICNTDYVYEGEETRKAHFDYRLQLVEGIEGTASVNQKWYEYATTITNVPDPVEPFPTEGALYGENINTGIDAIQVGEKASSSVIYPNPIASNDVLNIEFQDQQSVKKEVRIIDARGNILYVQQDIKTDRFEIPLESHLKQGIYFVNVRTDEMNDTHKFLVR
ncbi:T9SS type A sorting domain-containing protein [Draconibacterium sp. IB214405]|uniref:T9SS type A sorting domain-containing protein n=1 Tax=Draconibacterium sp. IB214405 TaxID=3097352 RepID=UPI002A16691C|nr:T9SS type A sorting domain-containing protein [Draconibacterium sp. IB214405]MDX8338986.1 T9SS type A sorting domain-containing protein [Draconibacterium sp. IB214405]